MYIAKVLTLFLWQFSSPNYERDNNACQNSYTYDYRASNNVLFLVLDLRNLHSVDVDVESKTAWVQAGATLGELYYRVARRSGNFGFPGGVCYTVGVGGQFGGGGYGFLSRKYGLAADNIIDAQLVDAQGRILDRKSMGEHLFWAIRGGGAASFGIVVAWKLQLVPVPSTVTVFDIKRNMEDDAAKKFIHRWQRRADKVDEDLTIFIQFHTVSSTDKQGNMTIVVQASVLATFHGGVDRLLQLMRKEFPELGLLRKDCIEMTWVESFLFFNGLVHGEPLEVLLDSIPGSNLSSKVKSDFVKVPVPDDALEGMFGLLLEEEVGRASIDLFPCGGKMDVIPESAIPFPNRAGNIYMTQYTVSWGKEEADIITLEKHLSWIRRLYEYMTPYVSKNPRTAYVNFRDLDLGINNYDSNATNNYKNIAEAYIWGSVYFKRNLNRLLYVKTIVDPTNFFRSEQSIPPLPVH